MRRVTCTVLLAAAALLLLAGARFAPATQAQGNNIFRISLNAISGVDSMDPALGSYPPAWALLDTTCARLMSYPDKRMPASFRLQPEVAAAFPTVSADGKTYTFRLRRGFRFSDGKPVRASAFARAINRVLAPAMKSPGVLYAREIVGAGRVLAGKASAASGVTAHGNTLVIRLTRRVPDFVQRTASTFFCAVPPSLPVDPEGFGVMAAAGPYHVTEYRRGERIALRKNRYYGGRRPHHVDGFDVDLRAPSPQEMLRRVERGEADWGHTLSGVYFDPALRLVEKYGLERKRLFLRPGLTLRLIAMNSSRPLFRNNPELRRAVNYALDRHALSRFSGVRASRPTDQYLPFGLPEFRNAAIYPLSKPNLTRARALAEGNLRGGRARLYVNNSAIPMGIGQLVKQQLKQIGLEVELVPIPIHSASAAYYRLLATPGEEWDLAFGLWSPAYLDPYAYINLLFERRFVGATNFSRFVSPTHDPQMRRAAGLPEVNVRSSTYGALDASLAREDAPLAAVDILNEPTLVSNRVGCIVLRPMLDLTAVCLK